jgi:hypothetical protein
MYKSFFFLKTNNIWELWPILSGLMATKGYKLNISRAFPKSIYIIALIELSLINIPAPLSARGFTFYVIMTT